MLKGLAQLQKHTRRVLITKRVLPVFAFLLIALIIVWPLFNDQKNSFSLGVSTNTAVKGAKMDMENIRFFGLNTKNLPMTLKSPTIKEIDLKTHKLRMETPVATYQMTNNEILTGKTPYALIFQDKEILFFEDQLDLTSSSGYKAVTSQVTCDYNQGTADSDQPISIKGPAGNIDAKGIRMTNKGDIILFKKDVFATIYQKKEQVKLTSPMGAEIDQTKNTLTTLGKTTIYHQGNILKADQMVAHYTDNKNARIEKIIANGNVSVENGKQKMTGQKATYYPEKRQIYMEENVVLSQGSNRVTGDKAVLDLTTGQSDLKATGRIKGQLIPNELKGNK